VNGQFRQHEPQVVLWDGFSIFEGASMKIEEMGHLLKNRLRQFKTGGCKVLSKGDDCDCSLCLVDNLLSHIFILEKKIKEIEG